MIDSILKLLKKEPLTISELNDKLKLKTAEEFINLNKTINKLIEDNTCFEVKDKIYSFENYQIDTIKRYDEFFYIGKGYSISNTSQFGLTYGDEIIYSVNKGNAYCIKVLKRKNIYVLGTIKRKRSLSLFTDDVRFASYHVTNFKEYDKQLKHNTRVRAYISDYVKKELKIDTIIGDINDKDILIKTILMFNDAPKSFSKETKKQLGEIDKIISLENRKDLRELSFITIDGDDSKDFDDAIYVSKNDGGYILYVSIADVSNYVQEKTPLDKDALKRGTSIYYPGHVIPMLPELLSNDLCSLNEHVDRYTITCQMNIDFDGTIKTYDIYPSVINSKKRCTYSKVNKLLEHDEKIISEYADIKDMIYTSYELSRILDHKRKEHGGIEFESNEPIIIEEDGKVIDIKIKETGKAELLIEDFMIIANTTIASHMYYLGYPLIYRNHDYPKPEIIEKFVELMKDFDYTFKGNIYELKSSQLQKCLDTFNNKEEYSLISDYLLRSMAKALYSINCNGHYGLGLEHYCHFTSPIRRYPDLIVHRCLRKYLFENSISDIDKDNIKNEKLALSSNEAERKAITIERNILDLKKCEYMSNKIGEIFDGIISSVVSYGFYVELNNTIEGLVHISNLEGYFEFFDDTLTNGEIRYKVGQKVKVRLADVDLNKRTIDFYLISKRRNS